MSEVNSIEDLYGKSHKLYKYAFFISLIVVTLLIALFFYQAGKIEKRYFALAPSLEKIPPVEAICEEGFKDIVTDKNESVFLSSGIQAILKQRPFIIDPFKIKSLGMKDGNCFIILISKKQTYLFKVGFIKNQLLGSVIDSVDQISPKDIL